MRAPTEENQALAWVYARPYVKLLLTAARLMGAVVTLDVIEVAWRKYDVTARWSIALPWRRWWNDPGNVHAARRFWRGLHVEGD